MYNESFWEVFKADYKKIRPSLSLRNILSALFFSHSFKRVLAYRLERRFYKNKLLRPLFYLIARHYSTKYSVYIDPTAVIGKGFNIAHCFSIIIAPDVKIGNNVTILQQVTLGQSRGGAEMVLQ